MRPRGERSAGLELMQMAGPMGGVEPSQAILHTSRALLVINERGWGNLYISQSYGPALASKQPDCPGAYFEPIVCFTLPTGRAEQNQPER